MMNSAKPAVWPEKILAICAIWMVVFINCASIQTSQLLTKVFGYIKIASLILIIVLGIYGILAGHAQLDMWLPSKR